MNPITRLTPQLARLIGARGLHLRHESGWVPGSRDEHGQVVSPYPGILATMMEETGGLLQITQRQIKEAVNGAAQRGVMPRAESLTVEELTALAAPPPPKVGIDPDATPEQAEQAVNELTELAKERLKLAHLRRLSSELLKEQARTGLIIESVLDSIKRMPPVDWSPAPTVIIKPDAVEEVPVAFLSDAQIGEVVDLAETGGLGYYNMDAFRRRLRNYADAILAIIDLHRKDAKIRRLIVPMLGDMVEGEVVFQGQTFRIELVVTDQLFEGANELIAALRYLLKSGLVEEIHVPCIGGNHGRTQHKKGSVKNHDNWDYVMYRHMQEVLRDEPRIHWFVPKSWWLLVDVLGWRIYMHHGDMIKSWLGVPYYGVQRHDWKATTLLQTADLWYHYSAMGDKHIAATLARPRGEQFMNGTLVGPSDFSLKELQAASEPTQLVVGINERHGATWRYPVILERIPLELRQKHLALYEVGDQAGESVRR